jgi:uncharacterized integral membrane protein
MSVHQRRDDDSEPRRDELHAVPRRPARSPAATRDLTDLGTLAVIVVVVVAALIFILQNRERVSVTFLSVDISAPIWVLVVGFFVLGGVIVGGVLWVRRSRG